MSRVVLIHWKPEEAEAHAAGLRRAGHRVRVMAPSGMPELRALRADPPDALVIDLGRLPSQGRAVAIALRQQKATRTLPLVFVEGRQEKTARVKKLLPDAFYTSWPSMAATLRRALRPAPVGRIAPRPVVPDAMAGYSGTPLPKKLGIKPGLTVALVKAPEGLGRTLGPLPDGVTLREGEGLRDRDRPRRTARTGPWPRRRPRGLQDRGHRRHLVRPVLRAPEGAAPVRLRGRIG
jgi:CheY-like chemotaxis protein